VEDLKGFICLKCGTRYGTRPEICIECWNVGVIVPEFKRLVTPDLPASRRVTAQELAASDQSVFSIPEYPSIRVQPNALVAVHGSAGSGKTTFAMRIASCLKPSLIVPLEMGIGPSLAGMLRRLEIRSNDIHLAEIRTTNELFDLCQEQRFRCVVIDSVSVSTFLPSDMSAIARSHNCIVIAVQQQTKQGLAAGSNAWPHEADVVINVDALRYDITKSRYQALPVAGEVLSAASVGLTMSPGDLINCVFCLEESAAEIRLDSKNRPYVICNSCGARSFLRAKRSMAGLERLWGPLVIALRAGDSDAARVLMQKNAVARPTPIAPVMGAPIMGAVSA